MVLHSFTAAIPSEDTEARRRAVILGGTAIGMTMCSVAIGVLGWTVQGAVTAPVMACWLSAAGFATGALLLARTGHLVVAGHLVLLSALGLFAANTYGLGGFHPGSIAGVMLVPLMALLVIGARAAIGWAVASAALTWGLAAARVMGVPAPPGIPLEQDVIMTSSSIVALTVVSTLLGWLFERERRAAIARLEQSNRDLDAFARSASHDLRGPARRTEQFAQFLLEDYGDRLDDAGRALVTRIGAQSGAMQKLIDDLLTLSRVGAAAVNRERVDVTAMAGSIVAELGDSQGVRIDIQPGLWLDADPALLRIALANLLSNAVKFTRDTPDAEVSVSLVRRDGRPALRVRDNGPGFDPAQTEKLFAPFERLHSNFEGTGVGLATVARIAERHGGRVLAEGAVGKGATFDLVLHG